ncbi:hypothetical protein [Thalassotalea agarivorans]|uniref:Porin n=1 Tax=Thalassotalea agarivorans TaxID=349064 RepID=A0A1H9Z7Z1_THASX|nr:hypothetical protein [Thalassotalea agarivorans]SES77628.1 hypothetical protein SAMN05660429_00355 [Thalassotalea agarivorans]
MLRSLSLTALLCLPLPVLADDFDVTGYLKSYLLYQQDIEIYGADDFALGNQSQNAARVMFSYLGGNHNAEVHYEIQPIYFTEANILSGNELLGSTFALASNRYRYKDLDQYIGDEDGDFVTLQNLDRFNYQYSDTWGDLTLGRQVISFGSARFINPTDIFVPFAIQTLNQEYRIGIDAVRAQFALGDFSTLDTGVIIGQDAEKENIAAFVRTKMTLDVNDVEAIAIALDSALLLGGGIERAIGDFGFWFEAAYLIANGDPLPNTITDTAPEFTDNYLRSSIGFDYALDEYTIVMAEYHYNGAGSNNAEDYTQLAETAPYLRGGVFLFGEHYIIPSLSRQLSALNTLAASAFINLSDQSTFVTLSMETSWSDNLYSDFGVYLTHGDALIQDQQQIVTRSEFGAYPLSAYASLRYYF